MPFMYPTDIAAKTIGKAYNWIGEATCKELVLTYAHAVYADRSASLSEVDLIRLKWMIGVYMTKTHDLATEAIESVLAEYLA
jgi:hypothetical protein